MAANHESHAGTPEAYRRRRGMREQELAQAKSVEMLKDAKQQAAEIIAQAHKHANEVIEESKNQAREEGARQLAAAKAEIEQEVNRARTQLRAQIADIAVAGAAKVLKQEIDVKAHSKMLDELAAQI